MKDIKASIQIDASEAVSQIEELIKLFQLKCGPLESIPNDVVNLFLDNISSLVNSVVLRDASTAVSATDAVKICFKIEIGGSADALAAAIRAGKMNGITGHNV
ncbi:hypothetical protein H8I91_09430 [Serratia fonticola]|uniref:hypothetical protein n=1 Tax=Serratia fonticola TaxID=47917 RepID=UPI0016465FA9|nr:hypothetical protein [Serratia fonticola]MBC3250483.1 hypothetical protein [Serratia fonticola]